MRSQWGEVHSKIYNSLEITIVYSGGSTIVVLNFSG